MIRIHIVLKRLARRTFARWLTDHCVVAHMYYYLQFTFMRLYWKDQIIIYQMGKVGSSSIGKSLKALNLGVAIYHVHRLNRDPRQRSWSTRVTGNKPAPPRTYWASHYLGKLIRKYGENYRWIIVTLVRDPVAINISAFFQNIHLFYSEHDQRANEGTINVDRLIEIFFKSYPHDLPITWFDRELKAVFGIDVYDSEFPKTKGYEIYQGARAQVLLLRVEDVDQCSQAAFREFLHIEKFNMIHANVGSQKTYSRLYRTFIDRINLPESYLDRMYNSKYAKHFYSPTEIEQFRANWKRPA